MALFSLDSKFMCFMDRLFDVLLLNLLWLVFCLPVITIGAATVAAYSVAFPMIDDEEGYIAKHFLKAFKSNFRQGTILWLLNAAALYALYIDWQIVLASENPSIIFIIVSILSTVFIFCAFVYAYPQTARYDNSVKRILENSIRISFRFFGKTGILIVVLTLEVGLFVWNTPMLIFGALVGPMMIFYTISGISKRIFEKLDDEGTPGVSDVRFGSGGSREGEK